MHACLHRCYTSILKIQMESEYSSGTPTSSYTESTDNADDAKWWPSQDLSESFFGGLTPDDPLTLTALVEPYFVDDCPEICDQQHSTSVSSGHSGAVTSICYCPMEKLVATGGSDGCLLLWDCRTRRQLAGRHRVGCSVDCLAYMSHGRLAVVGPNRRDVLLLPLEAMMIEEAINRDRQLPDCCAVQHFDSSVSCLEAASSNRLLVGCLDGKVLQLDVDNTKLGMRTLLQGGPQSSRVVLLSSVAAGGCGCAFLMRRLRESVRIVFPSPQSKRGRSRDRRRSSGGGARICSLSFDQFDLRPGELQPTRACPFTDSSTTLLMHGCSRMGHLDLLAIGPTGELLARLEAQPCHLSRLTAVCALSRGARGSAALLATGCQAGEVKVWLATLTASRIDLELVDIRYSRDGKEVTSLELVHISEDRQILLIGDDFGDLTICELKL